MGNILKLKSGQEFALAGVGYTKNAYNNTVAIIFTSNLDIAAVQTAFKDDDAISEISILLPDGTIKENVTDCITLQSISQDNISGKYTAILSTDKALLQKKIIATQEALNNANEVIDALSDAIVYISMPVMEGGE